MMMGVEMMDEPTSEEMRVRDIILMVIAKGQGRPEFGRTSLQKVSYFVGRALGRNLGHRAHYYGPFSSQLEVETETLALSGLIEEKVHPLGFANAAGFEAKQYEYSLTDLGRERVAELEERFPGESKVINDVVETLIEHAGRLDQRLLSPAAKVDFIGRQQDRVVTVPDIRLAAEDVGWSLSDRQVQDVVVLLEKLGFVNVEA